MPPGDASDSFEDSVEEGEADEQPGGEEDQYGVEEEEKTEQARENKAEGSKDNDVQSAVEETAATKKGDKVCIASVVDNGGEGDSTCGITANDVRGSDAVAVRLSAPTVETSGSQSVLTQGNPDSDLVEHEQGSEAHCNEVSDAPSGLRAVSVEGTQAKGRVNVSGRKRLASEVENDDIVLAPPFATEHESWTAFKSTLKSYMKQTKQKLVVKETISTKRRNKDLRSQAQYHDLPDEKLPLIPDEMGPYQRKYICTHGWPERNRSTGIRKVHKFNTTECPFQFLAQVTKREDKSWGNIVTREDYLHNHQVSDEIYRYYSGIRQVPQHSPLMPGIELLVQSKTSGIYDYIRQNSDHRVKMKDVQNIIARMRESGVDLSDDDAVAEAVTTFNLESPKNVSTVQQSVRGHTGTISLSSEHMRAMLDRFPEVLQMDTTHKTNKHNYQLLTMVAMDQFGHGQPVQYSMVETASDWHMTKCLEHFKRANDHWRFVRIVIVDKDMHEVEVVRRELPEATVLFCHFHVIKWLHEQIRKSAKFGTYTEETITQLRHTITNMMYARSEADYIVHRDEFKYLAGREGREELWEYFKKNWDSCKEMWVMAHRTDLPHFNNHTNNRVESLFGKVKRTIKGHYPMHKRLTHLLAWQRRKEEEYQSSMNMPGTVRNISYSDEMNVVLGMTTRWVAAAIDTQYKIATDADSASKYAFVDNGQTVTIRRGDNE